MNFSLFKKAVGADPDLERPPERSQSSGAKPSAKKQDVSQIRANNKKALDSVRLLETIGEMIHNKGKKLSEVDVSLCDPQSLTLDSEFKGNLSKADMEAIHRWVPSYNSWSQLFSALDNHIGILLASGFLDSYKGGDKSGQSLGEIDDNEAELIHDILNLIKETYVKNKDTLHERGYMGDKEYWLWNGGEQHISARGKGPITRGDFNAIKWLLNDSSRYTGGADMHSELMTELQNMNKTISKK